MTKDQTPSREEVIAWALESKIATYPEWAHGVRKGALERFAAIAYAAGAEAEREAGQKWFDAITAQHKQEILAEREACAKLCDAMWTGRGDLGAICSSAIRARKENT
jgi:hypothetical protein